MGNIIIAMIFAVSVTIIVYETYYEKKEEKVSKLLAPKIELLIQVSSREISIREKELNRSLTDIEKNEILDKCYQKM